MQHAVLLSWLLPRILHGKPLSHLQDSVPHQSEDISPVDLQLRLKQLAERRNGGRRLQKT